VENANEENKKYKERLIESHRFWFAKFADIFHKEETGPVWLKNSHIANLIADRLQYRDGKVYRLDAYCIMSNHVHIVFAPFLNESSLKEIKGSNPLRYESEEPTLSIIMQSLKGNSARKANQILNRRGIFWEAESYDHEIRDDEEMGRIISYVLNNPVKAGLVKAWHEYQWSWKRSTDPDVGQAVSLSMD
jgi:putative transposase